LEDLRAASRFLESETPSKIYSDRWGIAQLRFFGRGRLSGLETIEADVIPERDSYVVLGGSRGYDLSSEAVSRLLPSPYAEVHLDISRRPPTWDLLFKTSGSFHVARRTDLAIFQVSSPPTH
jgi:hypothetical protein